MASLDVCDETDAARVLVEGRIIKTSCSRNARVGGLARGPDIDSFHRSSLIGSMVIESIQTQSFWRALLLKGRCRAHCFPPRSPAALAGRHTLPPSPRAGAAARRLKYVKQAAFSPAEFYAKRAACRPSCDYALGRQSVRRRPRPAGPRPPK